MKRISIVGLGYIGLPTAIAAAQAGYEVFGFDVDNEKVKRINSGDPVIFEPELSDRLWKVLKNGRFKAYADLQYADCFVITVPTPFKEDKTADLSYVNKACEFVAKRLMPGNLVILESTVPVGTTERLAIQLEELTKLKFSSDFFVSHCPERVLPGRIFKELEENDRVIGGMCQKACDLSRIFYSSFVKGFLHITDEKTAEIVKLVENSSRDVQIAFANQVASMCATAGIDPFHVIDLANKHPRVKILTPGCGVGGHCLAVDPYFLIETFPEDTELLAAARKVNNLRPYQIIKKILYKTESLKILGIHRPKVLALGVTFKPNVDDIRESPALTIVRELNKKTDLFDLYVYDSHVPRELFERLDISYNNNLWDLLQNADIIVALVKHREFEFIPKEIFDNKILIDTCGMFHDIQASLSKSLLEGGTTKTPLLKLDNAVS